MWTCPRRQFWVWVAHILVSKTAAEARIRQRSGILGNCAVIKARGQQDRDDEEWQQQECPPPKLREVMQHHTREPQRGRNSRAGIWKRKSVAGAVAGSVAGSVGRDSGLRGSQLKCKVLCMSLLEKPQEPSREPKRRKRAVASGVESWGGCANKRECGNLEGCAGLDEELFGRHPPQKGRTKKDGGNANENSDGATAGMFDSASPSGPVP